MAERLAVVQNCYVVRDLEEACARMHRLYGIGPFVGGSPGEAVLANHVYRGTPAPPIRLRGVFVQSGELNIELVQILSDGPSAFHDMFADGAEGFHHTAIFCAEYDRTRDDWVAAGNPVASEFETGFGARICYVDARATHGHMVELYPDHPVIRGMYREAREAARQWDGRALFVPWGTYA